MAFLPDSHIYNTDSLTLFNSEQTYSAQVYLVYCLLPTNNRYS